MLTKCLFKKISVHIYALRNYYDDNDIFYGNLINKLTG